MGTIYGPNLVTDGLVLCLDAANTLSYPGSGTTWTDLTGNGYDGDVQNCTFSTNNAGVLVTSGSSGSLINIALPDYRYSDISIVVAQRYVTGSGGRMLNGRNNNWLLGNYSSKVNVYYAEGWIRYTGATNPDETGDTAFMSAWRIYTCTEDYSADNRLIYTNGVYGGEDAGYGPGSGTQGPNGLTVGRYLNGDTERTNGEIGFVLAYNRVLTASEILQNFEAHKGRYGL